MGIEATMANRENKMKAKYFCTSWKGAGTFKPMVSLTSPSWKDNPNAKTPRTNNTLWDPCNQSPYPVCPGAGAPFKPVGVGETSERVKFSRADPLLRAAGTGGTYAITPRTQKTPRALSWPEMAPPSTPGVGRHMGGIVGMPLESPRKFVPGQTIKTPRFNLTRCCTGNLITKASHPI